MAMDGAPTAVKLSCRVGALSPLPLNPEPAMNAMRIAALLVPVLLAACAAREERQVEVYDTDSRKVVTMTEKAAEAADVKVCTKEYELGSRFPVTTCLTPAQAAQRKEDAKDDQDLLLRRQAIPPNQ